MLRRKRESECQQIPMVHVHPLHVHPYRRIAVICKVLWLTRRDVGPRLCCFAADRTRERERERERERAAEVLCRRVSDSKRAGCAAPRGGPDYGRTIRAEEVAALRCEGRGIAWVP